MTDLFTSLHSYQPGRGISEEWKIENGESLCLCPVENFRASLKFLYLKAGFKQCCTSHRLGFLGKCDSNFSSNRKRRKFLSLSPFSNSYLSLTVKLARLHEVGLSLLFNRQGVCLSSRDYDGKGFGCQSPTIAGELIGRGRVKPLDG